MAQFDNISASFDGTTTSFALTISGSPVTLPAKRDIDIKVGGVEHYEGTDFTIAGSTITFSVAPYPGDLFAGEYLDPANSDYALAADLASKANQSDVDTNTSAIALRATQADLDALTDTVNNLPTGGGGGGATGSDVIDVTTDITTTEVVYAKDLVLGDSSPSVLLQDNDGTNQEGKLAQAGGAMLFTTRNGSSHGSIDFRSSSATNTLLRFRVASSGDFNWYKTDGTTTGMRWDASSGRVGVGTLSPTQALDVVGSVQASGAIKSSDLTLESSLPQVKLIDTDGDNLLATVRKNGSSVVFDSRNGDQHGAITFATTDGVDTLDRFKVTSNGNITFNDVNENAKLRFNATNGRLGLGTVSPIAPLDVTGNAHVSGVSTLDGGIKLGGTGAANLIDEYEEGTHTTLANHAGGWMTLTSGRDESNYVKVGKQVTVTGMITVDSLDGTEAGAIVLSLPFAVGTWGSTFSCRAVGSVMMNPSANAAGTLTAKSNSFILTAVQGSSEATIYEGIDGGITSNGVAEYLRAGTDITYTITYLTD